MTTDRNTSRYDPFGEPASAAVVPPGERRVQVAAALVFWTLAALLTAGRVYEQQPAPAQLAAAAVMIAAR